MVTLVRHERFARETGELKKLWPHTNPVADPEHVEWTGMAGDGDDIEPAPQPLPAGFLGATFHANPAGIDQRIVLRVNPDRVPEKWTVFALTNAGGSANAGQSLVASGHWRALNQPESIEVAWPQAQPPERLLVRWDAGEALLTLNIDDARALPLPESLMHMSSDDLLTILAASDPSAAFRVWARRQQVLDVFDDDLDSAMPADLDPLRRYDLQATFLHRIRRRARVLARLRENLQRPVWSQRALDWQLSGPIGIVALSERLRREFVVAASSDNAADEALLALADYLIVLSEVDYHPPPGALGRDVFEPAFRACLTRIAQALDGDVFTQADHLSAETTAFWRQVMSTCTQSSPT